LIGGKKREKIQLLLISRTEGGEGVIKRGEESIFFSMGGRERSFPLVSTNVESIEKSQQLSQKEEKSLSHLIQK